MGNCSINCSVCPFCGGPVCGDCGTSPCKGQKGQKGKGVPKGGLPGQVLTKLTEDNYDTYWTSLVSGGTGEVTSVTGDSDINAFPIVGDVLLSLLNTTVVPGSYTNTNLTVDSKGRLTNVSSGAAPGTAGTFNAETFEIIVSGTVSFGLDHIPIAKSEGVFLNGLRQKPDSYTLIGSTLTLDIDVLTITGDSLEVSYVY